MATFKIEGGTLLSGEITPQGAKNEALQVICATLLTGEPVTISNIPNIRDVNNLIQLLKDVGVKVLPGKPGGLGGKARLALDEPQQLSVKMSGAQAEPGVGGVDLDPLAVGHLDQQLRHVKAALPA